MSLDLNKLENKLDEALIKETTKTLTKFLNDKRMINNKQQTAVEWFVEELTKQNMFMNLFSKEIQQAKEMEKERITKAFDDGDYNYHYSRKTGNDFENGEE
jgi:hypothetical protein